MTSERVTITLPPEVVEEIDRQERNRSRFILQAVRRELQWRRRRELRRSLRNPHPEAEKTVELGIDDWGSQLPSGGGDLLDPDAGTNVRWTPGEGWIDVDR